MCGIAGVVTLAAGAPGPAEAELERMAGALFHRGPDEQGCYLDDRAGLAHTRLSIVDLATGQQPLANEDGSLWIVFNGEIFNHVELRAELEALGHRFRTRSDTEVIVHAYEAWGDEAFARFNGQFAVALWDAGRERLVLARDRLGVRPIYVREAGGRVWFASEVKALFAGDPGMPRALSPAGLAETFTLWTVVPPRTVFEGVEELVPGHVRTYERGARVGERAFWVPRYPEPDEAGRPERVGAFEGSIDDAARAVREALEQAVRLRMLRADVPVGSYLSGGLDSSIVAALGRQVKGERFHTFALRFEDAEYDETAFQRAMVAHVGSEHHEVVVTRRAIADALPEVVWHAERPLLRTAPAPMMLLSRLVREHGAKVVLTGEGADEAFAGYDLFGEGKVRRFWAKQPSSACRPRLLDRLYPYLAVSPVAQRAMSQKFFGRDLARAAEPGFAHATRWETTAALRRLFAPGLAAETAGMDPVGELVAGLPEGFSRWTPLAQDQWIETKTLLGGYLLSSQGDRMLMASSVEGRFPFLDVDVNALAASLPARFKLRGLDEKHVLKRAFRGVVPDVILDRKKQPYRAPDAMTFTGSDVPAWVDELTSEAALREVGVFDAGPVGQLVRKVRGRGDAAQFSNKDNMAFVGVLTTQLLHHALVASAPRVHPVTFTTRVDRRVERRA